MDKKRLLQEKKNLEKEYPINLNAHVTAFNKLRDLSPKFHVVSGVQIAQINIDDMDEYCKAEKAQHDSFTKYMSTLKRLTKINTLLRKKNN